MCTFGKLWVRPATEIATLFRPAVVQRLPTTVLGENWRCSDNEGYVLKLVIGALICTIDPLSVNLPDLFIF